MGDMDLAQDGRKAAAEFLGAFALIFIGAGSIIVTGGTDLVAIAFAHGLVIALMVSSLGTSRAGSSTPR